MNQSAPTVKIGTSRQIVIPKKIHDRLGLAAGDYLQVKLQAGTVVFTPKTLVDKQIADRLAEALDDVHHGRVSRPFRSAKSMIRALHQTQSTRRK